MLSGAKSSEIARFGPAGCVRLALRGAKSSEKASFGPAGCVRQVLRGAKSSENIRFRPAGCVAQVLRGAKSSKIARFGPAGCVRLALRGAKSSKIEKFGPAAASYRHAASGETPGAHACPGGVSIVSMICYINYPSTISTLYSFVPSSIGTMFPATSLPFTIIFLTPLHT